MHCGFTTNYLTFFAVFFPYLNELGIIFNTSAKNTLYYTHIKRFEKVLDLESGLRFAK